MDEYLHKESQACFKHGHALQANLSTGASFCCVLEVINAKLPSCPLFRNHIAFKAWEFYSCWWKEVEC